MKILWIDTETSGLNPFEHDILSIALLVEIDGQIKDELYLKIKPIRPANVTDEALAINGFKREELSTFLEPREALREILTMLEKYVDKYKKNKTSNDKFVLAGYNVTFDSSMLSEFCKNLNYKYLGALVDYHKIDIASLVLFLKINNKIKLEGYKLINVAEYFGTEFQAHNALSDIKTTRNIAYKLLNKITFNE